jgi:hypothetical protein
MGFGFTTGACCLIAVSGVLVSEQRSDSLVIYLNSEEQVAFRMRGVACLVL